MAEMNRGLSAARQRTPGALFCCGGFLAALLTFCHSLPVQPSEPAALGLARQAEIAAHRPPGTPGDTSRVATGHASYYSPQLAGNLTASGEPYHPDKLTAAHPSLPLGTRVRVTNTRNGRSVVVRINDRGPFVRKRIIDLSHAAARHLGMLRSGTAPVRVEVVRN